MNIVFMGTPDFAVGCLERLYKDGHNISGVFSQPDKPKGRGYTLTPPPVKEAALKLGFTVYQPKSMRDGETMKIIEELNPDLIAVVAFGKILPKEILDYPKYGCINVHGSLLPKYRGAAPIQWSVINGDRETGVTTMLMDEGLDTGDMLMTSVTPIGINDTAGEVFDRLSEMGAELLSRTVKAAEKGELTRTPQTTQSPITPLCFQKSFVLLIGKKTPLQFTILSEGFSPGLLLRQNTAIRFLKFIKLLFPIKKAEIRVSFTQRMKKYLSPAATENALSLLRFSLRVKSV